MREVRAARHPTSGRGNLAETIQDVACREAAGVHQGGARGEWEVEHMFCMVHGCAIFSFVRARPRLRLCSVYMNSTFAVLW